MLGAHTTAMRNHALWAVGLGMVLHPCAAAGTAGGVVERDVGRMTAGPGEVSIWPDTTTPVQASDPDTNAVEVGVKFEASVSGRITGIRFYKGADNGGTHAGHLWSAAGSLLGSVT